MGHAHGRLASHHALRIREIIIKTNERLAIRVVTLSLGVGQRIVGIVVATLLVFRLVVDGCPILNLHFACRPVALEVLHIRGSVPQAPLSKRKQFQAFHLVGGVLQRQLLHLSPSVQGHEEEHRSLHAVLTARDTGVVHAVATLIAVQWRLARLPARIPHTTAIVDVEIAATSIHGHTIITVARDATELSILIEIIATGSVRDEAEEVLIA